MLFMRAVSLLLLVVLGRGAHADESLWRGQLGLKSEGFISPARPEGSDYPWGAVSTRLQSEATGDRAPVLDDRRGLQFDLEGQFVPTHSLLSTLNPREIFYQRGGWTVGRELREWSRTDEQWHLGLFQPQFRSNPLRPESQGLTGLFLSEGSNSSELPWRVTAFGSFLFIPDQGPNYEIQNGKFTNANPWFSAPPERVRFASTGTTDPIDYDVERPDLSRIVFRPSLALQFRLGDRDRGWSGQLAVADKPMNQLNLALDASQSLAQNNVSVRVRPQVTSHQLVAADLHHGGEWLESGLGVIHERPRGTTPDSDWNEVTYGSSTWLAPYWGVRRPTWFAHVLGLHLDHAEDSVQGEKVSYVGSLFPRRSDFGDAAGVEAGQHWRLKKFTAIKWQSRYVQGTTEDFALWTTDVQYQWDPRWSAGLQATLVDAKRTTDPRSTVDIFSDHDFVSAGVSYVF